MNKPFPLSLTRILSASSRKCYLILMDLPREGWAGASVAPSHPILQTEVKRQVDAISVVIKTLPLLVKTAKITCISFCVLWHLNLHHRDFQKFHTAILMVLLNTVLFLYVICHGKQKFKYIKSTVASSTMQERAWRQKQDFFLGIVLFVSSVTAISQKVS